MALQIETLDTTLYNTTLGPYDSSLPGPIQLRLRLDGEVIVSCEVETGYLHRGLEKILEGEKWAAGVPYFDRIDPENAFFYELGYCLAVEKLLGLEVPSRAEAVRIILCELSRISSHLKSVVNFARAAGSETIVHYVLRDREKILDLFELIAGARFSSNYFCFGGVKYDITEGFIERACEACDLVQVRLKEINDIVSFNRSFLSRTTYVGVVKREWLSRYSVTGPVARGSGETMDVRRSYPYCRYEELDFRIPVGSGEYGVLGDAHDRYLLRLREIGQSVELIRQSCDRIPTGDFSSAGVQFDLRVPEGESLSRIEGPRGMVQVYLRSAGEITPARVMVRSASFSTIQLLPDLLRGARLSDLSVVLASLDMNISEIDR